MSRTALALYLMLATAAGPGLCCCPLDSLLALCLAPPKAAAGQHCCDLPPCDRDHPTRKPQGAPGDSPSAPRGPCPCQQNQSRPLAFLAPEQSTGAEQTGSFQTHLSVEAGWFPFHAGSVTLLARRHLPGASGTRVWQEPRDMLRALHILRC